MEWLVDPLGPDALDWGRHLEWGVVALRVVLGVVFVDSGLGKWRRGLSGTGNWFAGLGIPFPQASARLVATVELAGGLLLIVGLFTHWVAVPLAVNMAVATYVQRQLLHAPFQGGDVQGYELDVLMLAGCITLALTGAGVLSLDRLLAG